MLDLQNDQTKGIRRLVPRRSFGLWTREENNKNVKSQIFLSFIFMVSKCCVGFSEAPLHMNLPQNNNAHNPLWETLESFRPLVYTLGIQGFVVFCF